MRDKFIKLCSQVHAGRGRLKARVWQVVSVWVLLLSEQVVHVNGCGCEGHPVCRGTSKKVTKHLFNKARELTVVVEAMVLVLSREMLRGWASMLMLRASSARRRQPQAKRFLEDCQTRDSSCLFAMYGLHWSWPLHGVALDAN